MTTKTQHTPGPWAQSGQTIRSASGINIARTAFDFAVDQSEDAQWNGGGPLEPEAAANAALIASAPNLLAAAEAAVKAILGLPRRPTLTTVARISMDLDLAIVQARGREAS